MKFQKILILIITIFVLIGCGEDSEKPKVESRLKSSQLVFTRTAGDMRGLIKGSGLDLPYDKILYDVEMWKIEYQTMYKGQPVLASSLVFLPVSDEQSSFISFQHGTIADNASAPTQLPLNDVQSLLYAGLAGTGFITSIPDFVGFGSSVELMHPYYVEDVTAISIIDNVRASFELAQESDVSFNNRLYLAGYSGGGYATMAAHKYVEEIGVEYFSLEASFPASGGYDLKGVRDFFFDQEVYDQPFFMAYVMEAYRDAYDWDISVVGQLFNKPYSDILPGIFDGIKSGGTINELLNDTISILVNHEYLANPEDAKYSNISIAFEENSLLDWTPKIPMHMYHGDKDITVPYHTSVDTRNALLNNGASESVVTFTSLDGGTHYTGFVPYLIDFFDKLIQLEGK